jgi:hypothetical protein
VISQAKIIFWVIKRIVLVALMKNLWTQHGMALTDVKERNISRGGIEGRTNLDSKENRKEEPLRKSLGEVLYLLATEGSSPYIVQHQTPARANQKQAQCNDE